MAILNILRYPDARLHKVAAPVTVFDEALKKLVADMAETMYAAPGIGLAATQVDVHKRVIVIDVSERRDSLVVLINPEIVARPACRTSRKAACRCPASTTGGARRARQGARLDRNGKPSRSKRKACSRCASSTRWITCKGKVFVDYLSPLKQQRIRAKLAKQLRKSA